jgi:Ni,Fe-hydrogenase maturation factor
MLKVIGLGNILRGDDGIGAVIIKTLLSSLKPLKKERSQNRSNSAMQDLMLSPFWIIS